MTTSRLDSVPGLGEIRRKALLTRFGSVKRLAAASAEEIASVPGIGDRTAAAIVAALGGAAGTVPVTEGERPEVIDGDGPGIEAAAEAIDGEEPGIEAAAKVTDGETSGTGSDRSDRDERPNHTAPPDANRAAAGRH
jgi:excinuclease ABC subunit C